MPGEGVGDHECQRGPVAVVVVHQRFAEHVRAGERELERVIRQRAGAAVIARQVEGLQNIVKRHPPIRGGNRMVHSVIVREALLKFRNGRTAKTITVENCLERRRHGASDVTCAVPPNCPNH